MRLGEWRGKEFKGGQLGNAGFLQLEHIAASVADCPICEAVLDDKIKGMSVGASFKVLAHQLESKSSRWHQHVIPLGWAEVPVLSLTTSSLFSRLQGATHTHTHTLSCARDGAGVICRALSWEPPM